MTLVLPSHERPLDPSWWAPLEAVAHVIAGDHRYQFFELADFMLMAKVARRGPRADILLYKHYWTRHCLNLDAGGHAYRYVSPPPTSSRDGRYLVHHSLRDGLDALDLWELPWMKPGLEEHRRGLSWEERWMLHPDVDDTPGDEGSDGRLRVV